MTRARALPHDLDITPALAGELGELSALALRAKAHWGYPAEWLEEWRKQLTITVAELERQVIFVARHNGERLGFYGLELGGKVASLEYMWVDPPAMGQGVGRRLLEHAQHQAALRGCRTIELDADPNAEAFYLHLGAVRIGWTDAPVAGLPRRLPRLELRCG